MTPRLDTIRTEWREAWSGAIEVWSRFVKITEPRWCLDEEDRRREKLHGSFAMIRLIDHAVVIDLAEIEKLGLQGFATEILAHEIGHHVYAPGDLVDNARLLARIRRTIPTRESYAPLVSNLYTDLLINDRLQRSSRLDIAGVYARLSSEDVDDIWALYMRTYEILWSLPFGSLIAERFIGAGVAQDAALAARVVRVYGKQWLEGAGRIGALMLPYLLAKKPQQAQIMPWLDALSAGAGEILPDGLAGIDPDEADGAIHPAEDPMITGIDQGESSTKGRPGRGGGAAKIGGQKNRYRAPHEYVQLMKSLGVRVDEKDLLIRYYKELAVPHIVPFPVRFTEEAADPLPEGLEIWDPGGSIADVDWVASVIRSPSIVPGITTMERVYGTSQGSDKGKSSVDLFLGVDCSGSMTNPSYGVSFPVIAGAAIALSALRSGSRVKVSLSGEPGMFSETTGFLRDEHAVLGVLTEYLGTGYAFGVLRLADTFLAPDVKFIRPVHILVVTDSDIFSMLDEVKDGWDIIDRAAKVAGGGATFVLDRVDTEYFREELARLEECNWRVHHVADQEGLVSFARAFAREHFSGDRQGSLP